MKLYKLSLVIHQPSEETEDKYMAEVPALPGCRAWGDTPTEVVENLQSVAAGFIDSYIASGDPLPPRWWRCLPRLQILRFPVNLQSRFELPRINTAIAALGM